MNVRQQNRICFKLKHFTNADFSNTIKMYDGGRGGVISKSNQYGIYDVIFVKYDNCRADFKCFVNVRLCFENKLKLVYVYVFKYAMYLEHTSGVNQNL